MSNAGTTATDGDAARNAALAEAKAHLGETTGRYADLWVTTTTKMLAGDYGVKSFNQDAATLWSTWVGDVVNCVRIAGDLAKTYAPPAAPNGGTSPGDTGTSPGDT